MKILGLAGSPRKGGNSDLLLDAMLEGAKGRGASVKKIYLNDLDIQPCQACYACKKRGKCKLDDEMARVLKELVSADVWVFATPVYWWGASAQLKLAIDRMFPFCHEDNGLPDKVKGKRFALITASQDDPENAALYIKGMMKESMNYLGIEWAGEVLAQAYEKGEIKNDKKTLKKAARLGERLAA